MAFRLIRRILCFFVACLLMTACARDVSETEPPPMITPETVIQPTILDPEPLKITSDNINNLQQLEVIWPMDMIYALAINPDGSLIASAGDLGVWIHDASTLERLQLLEGHSDRVRDAAWSPDGSMLASASSDMTILVWNPHTGEQLTKLSGHLDRVNALSWSGDGKRLASGSWDATVRVWDPLTGKQLHVLRGHRWPVSRISWSPDGTRLISSDWEGTAKIWDPYSGVQLNIIEDFGIILDFAWSPDGTKLAVLHKGSPDSKDVLTVWDPTRQAVIYSVDGDHSSDFAYLSWSPDGKNILLSTDSGNVVRDALTGEQRPEFDISSDTPSYSDDFMHFEWTPDSTRLISGGEEQILRVWDAESGALVLEQPVQAPMGGVYSLALTTDGLLLAAGEAEGNIFVYDTHQGDLVSVLEGHPDSIRCLAWSPDGTRLASAGVDGTVTIWDPREVEVIRLLKGHDEEVTSVDWSPDGTQIVSGSLDETILIWDVSTGESIHQLDGHSSWVDSVDWSPDGRHIASAALRDEQVFIWDADTGRQLERLEAYRYGGDVVDWSPSGGSLASVGGDDVRIWDTSTWTLTREIIGRYNGLESLTWSPNESFIAAGDCEGEVVVWDLTTGEELIILEHSTSMITICVSGVVWLPDGEKIISGAQDGIIRFWGLGEIELAQDTEPGLMEGVGIASEQFPLSYIGIIGPMDLSLDGQTIALRYGTNVLLYDYESLELIKALSGHHWLEVDLAWSPSSDQLATADGEGIIRIWDPLTGDETRSWEGSAGSIESISWSQQDSLLATGDYYDFVRIWNPTTGEEIVNWSIERDQRPTVDWSPDGTMLATGTPAMYGGSVLILDGKSGENLQELIGSAAYLDWSADGNFLASSGTSSETIRIWEVNSGELIQTLEIPDSYRNAFVWSPKGILLAEAGTDGRVTVWDAPAGQQLATIESSIAVEAEALTWSNEGKTLIVCNGEGTIQEWDWENGILLRSNPRTGHAHGLNDVAWSPDEAMLATAGDDGTVRLWDRGTGEQISILRRHTGEVWRVEWSPEGSRLASVGPNDANILIWDSYSGELVDEIPSSGIGMLTIAWSPDGKSLASSTYTASEIIIEIFEMDSGRQIRSFEGHPSGVFDLAWAPNGQWIAWSGWEEFAIHVVDIYDGREIYMLEGHLRSNITEYAWSPDGTTLASTSSDSTLRLWDMETGEAVQIFETPGEELFDVIWSSDGLQLATTSNVGSIRIWDVATGVEIGIWICPNEGCELGIVEWLSTGIESVGLNGEESVVLWKLGGG